MNLSQYKTVIVLHHPGAGGNHLANMLSLSPRLADRFQHNNYSTELLRLYQEHPRTAAHYKDVRSPDGEGVDLSIMYNAIESSSLPYIITAHKIQDSVAERLLEIGPVAVVKIILPSPSLLANRKTDTGLNITYEYNPAINQYLNGYQFGKENEYRIHGLSFIRPTAQTLYTTLNQDLGLNLDTNVCNKLHSIWFNKCFVTTKN